eukprot:5743654-Pleurochrysis_carterae.AAC.1
MSELIEHNVHLVENVTMRDANGNYLRRQPLPALPALYLLTPTVESVNRFLDDFREKKPPLYARAHLFFTSRISDALLAKIKNSAAAMRAIGSFKELNLEFALAEANVFTLNKPDALTTLFCDDANASVSALKLQVAHDDGARAR